MAGMLLIRPMSATFSAGGIGVANLGTPSPREVWVAAATGEAVIELDFGETVSADCFVLINTNARADSTWAVQSISGPGGSVIATLAPAQPVRLAGCIRPRFPGLIRLAAPVDVRHIRLTFQQSGAPLEIGRLVSGKAIELPYAFGSGRMPIDTSKVVSLHDGGFGIDRGVVKTSLQWRFVDLGAHALDELWALAENRGESLPLVVVEGPDYPPPATSVHYGLFRRFEAFEREDPALTKWALSVEEWR